MLHDEPGAMSGRARSLRSRDSRGGCPYASAPLLFEDFDCFWGGAVFFSNSAGDIAERRVVHGRCQVGKRNFSLRVGIRRVAAEQAYLIRHCMFGGAPRMVLHLNRRRDIAEHGSGLGKGRGGAEKA